MYRYRWWWCMIVFVFYLIWIKLLLYYHHHHHHWQQQRRTKLNETREREKKIEIEIYSLFSWKKKKTTRGQICTTNGLIFGNEKKLSIDLFDFIFFSFLFLSTDNLNLFVCLFVLSLISKIDGEKNRKQKQNKKKFVLIIVNWME